MVNTLTTNRKKILLAFCLAPTCLAAASASGAKTGGQNLQALNQHPENSLPGRVERSAGGGCAGAGEVRRFAVRDRRLARGT